MSYPIGTTLRRKTPFTDKDKAHLNFVEVTGTSPVSGAALAEWSGVSGSAVVVRPAEGFGPSESLPVEIGNREYDVVFMPEPEPLTTTTERVTKPPERLRAETPEQAFARDAVAATPEPAVAPEPEKPTASAPEKAKGK